MTRPVSRGFQFAVAASCPVFSSWFCPSCPRSWFTRRLTNNENQEPRTIRYRADQGPRTGPSTRDHLTKDHRVGKTSIRRARSRLGPTQRGPGVGRQDAGRLQPLSARTGAGRFRGGVPHGAAFPQFAFGAIDRRGVRSGLFASSISSMASAGRGARTKALRVCSPIARTGGLHVFDPSATTPVLSVRASADARRWPGGRARQLVTNERSIQRVHWQLVQVVARKPVPKSSRYT